jgi:hypothetical protein
MRDWAQRVGRKPFLGDAIFGGLYAVAAWLLSLPLTIYQGYFREHRYAMATQSFGSYKKGASIRLRQRTARPVAATQSEKDSSGSRA